jgi:hypothetical protein
MSQAVVQNILGSEELKKLADFRETMLALIEEEANAFIESLDLTYPNMDIVVFMDDISDAIDDFTYEIEEENEIDTTEDDTTNPYEGMYD